MTNIKSFLPLFIFLSGLAAGLPSGRYVGHMEGQIQTYERVVGDMQQATAMGDNSLKEKTPGWLPGVKVKPAQVH